jgi:hypothetical protein
MEYFTKQTKKAKIFDRKSDTRKKIQLGGLLVKAGLDYMHPQDAYVLYGMLLDCKKALEVKPEVKERWAHLGKELLLSNHD